MDWLASCEIFRASCKARLEGAGLRIGHAQPRPFLRQPFQDFGDDVDVDSIGIIGFFRFNPRVGRLDVGLRLSFGLRLRVVARKRRLYLIHHKDVGFRRAALIEHVSVGHLRDVALPLGECEGEIERLRLRPLTPAASRVPRTIW